MALTPEQRAELSARVDYGAEAAAPTPKTNYRQEEVDRLGALRKLQYGGSSLAEDAINRGRQLYQKTPMGTPEGLENVYSDIALKNANPVDDTMVGLGYVGSSVIPAIAAARAGGGAIPAAIGGSKMLSTLASLGIDVGSAVAGGNLLRPLEKGEDTLENQAENAQTDAMWGALSTIGQGAKIAGQKGYRAAKRLLPQEAVDDLLTKVAPTGGKSAADVTQAAGKNVDSAVRAAKAKASQYYKSAEELAGSDPLRLTNAHTIAQDIPANISEVLATSSSPTVRKMAAGTIKGSTSPIVSATGGTLPSASNTLTDTIGARKSLGRIQRKLLSGEQPDTEGAAVIGRLMGGIDDDIAEFGKTSQSNAKAVEQYGKGKGIYWDTVLPLTSKGTQAGKVVRGGERGVDDIIESGLAVRELSKFNPDVKSSARALHANKLRSAAHSPSTQANLMSMDSIEEMYSPETVRYMRDMARSLRGSPTREAGTIAGESVTRTNPMAAMIVDTFGRGGNVDRMMHGVDSYGVLQKKFIPNKAASALFAPVLTLDQDQ